jgi:hypothetical protein
VDERATSEGPEAPDGGVRFPAASTAAAGAALFLVALAASAWQAHRADFISDDAFISFRYARNLLDGHGLVFNPGERVEGYTNLLYVLLVAGVSWFGLDCVTAGRAIGIVSTALLAFATCAACLKVTGRKGQPYAVLAAAALLLNPFLAIWTSGGLETPLFALLNMATVLAAIALEPGRRSFFLISALGLGLTLTRPEGIGAYVFTAAWCFLSWDRPAKAKAALLLPGATLFLLGVSAVTGWRLWYYGDPLPNTFYVKSGFTASHLARGLSYAGAFARNGYVPASLVLGLVAAILLPAKRTFYLIGFLLTLLVEVILVGGDGLPAYRFMVPLLAPMFTLAGLGLFALNRRLQHSDVAAICLMAAGVGLAAWSFHPRRDISYLMVEEQKSDVAVWSRVGRWLKANVPPTTVVATVPIGAVAFYSGLPTIDMMGLTDRHIARVPVMQLGKGWAGHEKHDGAYVLSREPDMLLLGNIHVSREPQTTISRIYSSMAPAVMIREYDIVSNPTFQRNYHHRSYPLGDGTYLHAFVRR